MGVRISTHLRILHSPSPSIRCSLIIRPIINGIRLSSSLPISHSINIRIRISLIRILSIFRNISLHITIDQIPYISRNNTSNITHITHITLTLVIDMANTRTRTITTYITS